eukprot:305047_1
MSTRINVSINIQQPPPILFPRAIQIIKLTSDTFSTTPNASNSNIQIPTMHSDDNLLEGDVKNTSDLLYEIPMNDSEPSAPPIDNAPVDKRIIHMERLNTINENDKRILVNDEGDNKPINNQYDIPCIAITADITDTISEIDEEKMLPLTPLAVDLDDIITQNYQKQLSICIARQASRIQINDKIVDNNTAHTPKTKDIEEVYSYEMLSHPQAQQPINPLPQLEGWIDVIEMKELKWCKKWVAVKDTYLYCTNDKSMIGISVSLDSIKSVSANSKTEFSIMFSENKNEKQMHFKCMTTLDRDFWVTGVKLYIEHSKSVIQYMDDEKNYESNADSETSTETLATTAVHVSDDKLIQCLQNLKRYLNADIDEQQFDVTAFLNDFLYLLAHHNTDNDMQLIYDTLGTQCDVKRCKIFSRHYERGAINRVGWKQQIVDKVHCFYLHLIDIEYPSEMNNDKLINNNNDRFKRRSTNRFRQVFNTQNIEMNDTINNKMYSFGTQFKYGYLNEDKYKIYDDVKEWIDNNAVEVTAKYDTIKKELINNKIETITMVQFNDEYDKAKTHLATDFRKEKYININTEQLLSLIIYCNHTVLQSKFSGTYYKDIKQHNNFYHLGKNIKIAVHKFGEE